MGPGGGIDSSGAGADAKPWRVYHDFQCSDIKNVSRLAFEAGRVILHCILYFLLVGGPQSHLASSVKSIMLYQVSFFLIIK